ncbi:MAG: hypothetical protein JO348_15050 [Alphaproteobacteria bacterium]|nr:hypothetical protein [Alphaproteobacteria bacterium]MBV9421084.1 hypothetical protein [Alphaproteobacteria bacterium]MBV9541541.1 hypothetical protein [Alphaproteobacteria bacterium]
MLKLSAAELARVHEVTRSVRDRTSARFEVVIVPVSDRYALYPIAFGALAALAAAGLLALARTSLGAQGLFAIEAVVFVLVSVVLEWLPAKLLLVPRRQKEERARQFAHRAFAATILAAREREVGMVLFASLGERYVELVTDDALDRRVGQAVWNGIVADFTAAARAGRLADGLSGAIEACGRQLAQHFPK